MYSGRSPRPEMSHDDSQPHEYEDIQELRTTNRNDGGSPPDEPNMVAQYTFTQCPAYGPVPPHMSHDNLQPPVYKEIQELCATNNSNDGGLPDEPKTFTQCSA